MRVALVIALALVGAVLGIDLKAPLYVTVATPTDSRAFEAELEHPSASKRAATVRPDDKMTFSWKVKTRLPFVAIAFSHQQMPNKVALLTFEYANANTHKLTLDMKSKLADFFYAHPGTYDMTLYASDGAAKQVSWPIGSVAFQLPAFNPIPDTLKLLPTIEHQFRSDASMPPAAFSWIYSGIVLAPWLFLITAWTWLGVNISAFPWRIGPLTASLTFLGSIVGTIGSLFMYWWQWNIFQTLSYMGPIAVIMAISGRAVLSEVATRK